MKKQHTIAVVDDNPDILDAIKILLEQENYHVLVSQDGVLLENFPHDLPDLILLDVLLSGKDGRDICRTLKANSLTKKIPVIILSAHPSAGENAVACGADDFVAKPFEIEVLLKKIRKHL
jgi:DNA-binding response OmpR family regulator